MGLRLFDRNRRRVALTPAGAVFFDEAKAVLGHVDRAVEAARRAARGELGSLGSGTSRPWSSRACLRSCGGFASAFPASMCGSRR
jgi:DNA-binding transcriptional LysR family regulator